MRVAVGRLTRSISASSLGVSGPCRSIAASAEAAVGVSAAPSPAASCRSRRAVRTIASRSRAAEPSSDRSRVWGVAADTGSATASGLVCLSIAVID